MVDVDPRVHSLAWCTCDVCNLVASRIWNLVLQRSVFCGGTRLCLGGRGLVFEEWHGVRLTNLVHCIWDMLCLARILIVLTFVLCIMNGDVNPNGGGVPKSASERKRDSRKKALSSLKAVRAVRCRRNTKEISKQRRELCAAIGEEEREKVNSHRRELHAGAADRVNEQRHGLHASIGDKEKEEANERRRELCASIG